MRLVEMFREQLRTLDADYIFVVCTMRHAASVQFLRALYADSDRSVPHFSLVPFGHIWSHLVPFGLIGPII